MKTLWLDFETTGLDPQIHRIIEAALILHEPNKEDKIFHTYVKYDSYPDDFITENSRAKEITGLTPEFLEEKGVSEKKLFQGMQWFFNQFVNKFDRFDKFILAGYNIDFDDNFSRALFQRYGENYYGSYIMNCRLNVMSSIANATRLKKMPPLKSYKLQEVAKYFELDNFQAHSAIQDIRVTQKIQKKLDILLYQKS